ncbi:MAG: SPOR domain-containing protein [Gallionellaceae bacterium]|nr:SPOR domain-containing protein [Gallionellaceae bacterium]
MAETTPTAEELALRRRARRRLVGAVALALVAVVVLPMVFDSEPRPLGDKVDIRIPDQKTPFEPAAMPAPVVTSSEPAPEETTPASLPQEADKPEAKPEVKAAPAVKPAAKPETRTPPASKVASKPEPKPEPKPEARPAETKPVATDKPGDAYFLQLGVFSSQANATQMIAKAKVAGFKASSIQVGSQYKVRIGPVPERDRALDYQAKLKAKGLDNVLVEP